MKRVLALATGFGILGVAMTSVCQAQVRTFVSGVGDDVNPCTRTAPCKTWAGAIAKTADGGEIDALDVGGFGTITITKSITIDGGTAGGISAPASNGVNVNGNGNHSIVVVLRNLRINGHGTGQIGVRFFDGKELVIENSTISGFTLYGVFVQSMPGAGNVVIRNSRISGNVDAVRTAFGTTTVSNSVLSENSGYALITENTGVINADGNVLTENTTALQAGNGGAAQGAATIRISNNNVYNNLNGFVCAGGVIASDGTNRKGGNTGGASTPCVPNGTITRQ